jgi:hypothetical protein
VTEVAERVRSDSGGQIGRAGEQRDVLVARNSSSFSPLMAES